MVESCVRSIEPAVGVIALIAIFIPIGHHKIDEILRKSQLWGLGCCTG